jgi:hypothetical protein
MGVDHENRSNDSHPSRGLQLSSYTINSFELKTSNYCYFALYSRMRIISLQDNIIKSKSINFFYIWIQSYCRKIFWFPHQLFTSLCLMIFIEMGISECMDKFPWLNSQYMCEHEGQKCIRSYIKWYSEKNISTSLIELT